MKFYLLVCCAFFIPHILGINDTTSNLEHNINSTGAVAKKVQKTTPIVTNTLITEGGTVIQGGTIIQNTPSEDLITVDKELGNRSHSTIVPRKEAKLRDTDDYHPNSSATDSNIDKMENQTRRKDYHLKNDTVANLSTIDTKNTTHTFVSKLDTNNSSDAVTPLPSVETKKQDKVKPKKPTILSYEGLANMDLKVESKSKSHKVSSSIPVSKLLAANQHPGMIMPIVIAILVVPMFAVLGYMALRRGQEAWKNRHYKRMDFLLDGMYNE